MRKKEKSGFPGGVHPTDGYDKSLTMNLPVRVYCPDTVTILAEQSFGGKCGLSVKPGDQVEEGSRIGNPEAFMAAPLHASVSGEVLEVKEVTNQGRNILACIVKTVKKSQEDTKNYEKEAAVLESFTREEIIAGIRDGGLTGMGGAGFPTHKKYETDKQIDALLINGAECEPFLTCDYRLMMECGYAVVNGVRLMLKASGAKNAYICIEDNKPQAVENLKRILEEARTSGVMAADENVEVCALPTKYPQGGERQLIQSVLKREVPMGGLPADVGVIVSNVGTARAAADMILGGKPLTRRIVTVTGCVKNPGNYLVPIGTSAKELVELCGGVTVKNNRVIAGGPMTGPCVASDWDGESELFYVTKNTSGILVLPDSHYEENPCIRCGACANVCPAGLVPWQIEFAYSEEDYDLCESLYASECIACGCCSYTCPAKRELAVRNRMARDMVKQRMRERAVKKIMSQARVINGPHVRTERTTRSVMMHVSISLIPALLGAIYYFGIRALYLTGLSVSVCVLTEYLWQKITKKQVTAGDFSAVVTGILLAFNMPVTAPTWVVAAASVFSILFVKQMFGGIGNNFVNPALMGRLLIMVAWPGTVMQYVAPQTVQADAVSAATVLGSVKNGGEAAYSYWQMFIGEMPGAMGETSTLLLLIGFAYMCYKGIVNAEASFTYIATVLALTFVFGPEGLFTGDILMNLFGGGLVLGGCYMLTDYAFTSRKGKLLYALTAGVITAGIRIFSNYPEGICFGILTANCMAGMLSMFYKQHVYGTKKQKA